MQGIEEFSFQVSGKTRHQWIVLAADNLRFWKNRSPIKRIGAQQFEILEKQVINKAYWRPTICVLRKTGHQWIVLAPDNLRFEKNRSPMERIDARQFAF
jgi:hypothetical protein